MTENLPHMHGVSRIKEMLRNGGAIILENDNEIGIGGFKFPRCQTSRHVEPIEYTADCFAILPNCQPIIVEVDGIKSGQGHFSERAVNRDKHRDLYFQNNYGIITVRFTTPDALEITEAQLWEEIEFWTKDYRKKLMAMASKPLTA